MDFFGKKNAQDIIDEGFNEDLEDMPFEDAKEIILVPNQFDIDIQWSDKGKESFFKTLIGKKVSKGSIVFKEAKKEDKFFSDFEEQLGVEFSNKFKIVVEKTDPEGVVKITKKTSIRLEKRKAKSEDIPQDKIIEISNLPDLKGLIKINKITDLIKLAKAGNWINKFSSKSKTIYICSPYYFEEIN